MKWGVRNPWFVDKNRDTQVVWDDCRINKSFFLCVGEFFLSVVGECRCKQGNQIRWISGEWVSVSRVFVKAERNLVCSSNTILKIGDLNSWQSLHWDRHLEPTLDSNYCDVLIKTLSTSVNIFCVIHSFIKIKNMITVYVQNKWKSEMRNVKIQIKKVKHKKKSTNTQGSSIKTEW